VKETVPLKASSLLALIATLITLALMIYMARPWGDNPANQSLSGYAWLLGFAVWTTLPYLMTLFIAPKAAPFRVGNLIDIIVTLIITVGGVALYVDAAFLHPDPQGALVLIAVPLYQWIILAFWAGIRFFLLRSQLQ
jgi:hypothetical protein